MNNPTTRTRIEQAIAYGRDIEWMIEHLGVSSKQIDETMRYLDRVNGTDDVDDCPQEVIAPAPKPVENPQPRPQVKLKPRRRPAESDGMEALAEAARLESARVYGRLCPEHRSSDDEATLVALVDLEAARRRRSA